MKKFLAIGLAALLAIGATIVPDEFDKLFLRCDGTTTTFVDSSTANPKTITANGNATQIPVLEAGKPQAMFFNGTTDYVDIANSADFAFGVGAFEIEFSFMTNIAATAQTIIDNRTATADMDAWLVNIINSSGNKLCFTTATTARITGTTTLAINTKYRCKIVGNGGANGARTVTMYLAVGDGDYAQEGSTYTADYNFAKETLRIGSVKATAGTYYKGWLKNLTLKKATTTVLDMRGDTGATSPLGPAIAFDGTGDYLSLADSADWDSSTANTWECWANLDEVNNDDTIMGQWEGASSYWYIHFDSGNFKFLAESPSGNVSVSVTYTPTVGKWTHLAVVHNGSDWHFFADGRLIGTATDADNFSGIAGSLYIGAKNTSSGNIKGYLREIRISDVARYTTAFTPSQTGFTVDSNTKLYIKGDENNGVTTFVDQTGKDVTTVGDTKIKYTEDYRSCIFKNENTEADRYTSLLLRGNGADASTNIVDDSGKGHRMLAGGNAQIDTAQSVFGGSSINFDGTGDYLVKDSMEYTLNQDFSAWTAGDSSAPDNWTLSGGSIAKESTIIKQSGSSAKLTGAGAGQNAFLYQNILPALGGASAQGKTVKVGMWVYATEANKARLFCGGGTNTSVFSTWHTGDSTWQFLTADFAIANDATVAYVYCQVYNTSNPAYFDKVACQFSTIEDFHFGSGDFTIDFWVRSTDWSKTYQHFIGQFNWYVSSGWMCRYVQSTGKVQFYYEKTTDSDPANCSSVADWSWSPSNDTWYHMAFVRSGANLDLYIDGSKVGSSHNIGTATIYPAIAPLTISSFTSAYAQSLGVWGWMDEIRVSKGIARWTSNFTKPAEPYTVLHYPYPQGSAKVDFFSAFGSGVGLFGTSGATSISTPDSDDFNMTADHTLEGYFRISDTTKGAIIAVQAQDATNGWQFAYQNTTVHYRYYVSNSYALDLTTSWTPVANTWYHFSATRYGNVWTIWLNGSSLVTYTGAYTVPNFTGNFYVGGEDVTWGHYTEGRLDNIRISKGIARYTSTFNPPEDYARTGSKRKKASSWWNFF